MFGAKWRLELGATWMDDHTTGKKQKRMPLLWIEHSTSRMQLLAGHEVDFSLALSQVS